MLAMLLLITTRLHAQDSNDAVFDNKAALQKSQKAIGSIVDDLTFVDSQNKVQQLSDFHGKPLVINLLYTSCYHSCSVITRNLANLVEIAKEALGQQSFNVLSIGFDTANDTPSRMLSYARQQGLAKAEDWYFLSADATTITTLSEQLGFIYYASSKGFDHLAQVSILDEQGSIYRQVYGETMDAPSFVEPLKELVFDLQAKPTSIDQWVTNIRLFCTIYDPSSGRYKFDYSIFMALATGLLSFGALGVFIYFAWRGQSSANNNRFS